MEGTEKIKEKIIEEANAEIKKSNDEVKAEVEEIKKEARETIAGIKKKIEEEKEHEIKLFNDKTLAQARLKGKRKYLETREGIMDSFIEKGAEEAVKKGEYKKFLDGLVKKNKDLLGEGVTVCCSPKDMSVVNKILHELKLKNKVKAVEIDGGIILEDSEGKRINESLASILERKRDELRSKIVNMLGE